ncbi:MAG: cell wall-binding repeat-containing protein, partial [Finegoldia magna]|nr:cell wall-binding repeat-containing protein [Finegoldia magna]
GLTDDQIEVKEDGTVVVTKDGKETTIPASDVVKEKATPAVLKAPTKPVEVKDPSKLTEYEKKAVEKAVRDANKDLPADAKVTVADDGSVTVTGKDGKELGKLTPKETVKKAVDKTGLQKEADKKDTTKASDRYKNADSDKKKAYDDALDDAKKVLDNPNATQEEVNKAKDALKAAEEALNGKAAPTVKAPDTLVVAENSKALTPDEKKAVEEEVRKANPDLPADAKITVSNDGTVTVKDKDGKLLGTIAPKDVVKQDDNNLAVKAPTLVEVKNPEQLTEDEKTAIIDGVKKANPDLADATITVDDKGNVTVTKDGKTGTLTPAQTVVKSGDVDKSQLEDELSKEDAIKDSDKYKNADKDKKDSYDESVDKGKEVQKKDDATQEDVNNAKDALEKAADELNGKATDKSKLEAEVAKKDATKASDKYKYADAAKKKAYDDALAKAKKVLNNPKASQAEVDAALDALQKAESALNGTKPFDGGTTPAYPDYPLYPYNPQTPGTTTESRVSGNDRIQTAIEISKKYFGHADTVIVVDSNNYADAITASVLSKLMNAPILLTDTHKLDPRVGAEIERLGAKDVIIVGGHNSVADSVKGELKAYDEDSVERIWGNDRYETSAQVARRIVGITGKKGHAVIASGEVFADALAVGPYAAQQGYPILLVQAKNIPTTINKALKDLGIKNVTIAGGLNTVSKSLENPLPNVVERLQGKSRYETAIAIAQSKFPQAKEAFLVNGEQWMDALVIAPVGGIMSKPILLTPSNNAPQSLKDYLIKSEIERLTAVGGNRMVSEQVLKELTKK